MGIEQYVHEHALTLCEKGNDGEILCYGCGNPFPVESESFYSYRCFACDERALGSFYICKLCLPESPIFHKSCFDISQKIQITYFFHTALSSFKKKMA
ncbi:hypothetical protein OWV82_014465 [Melia azedarach]|uniref:Uncharacterized protein n=1 Tax=Melia azedarach TaxID=155640 RepID=A0ACC1XLR8_MELAZ|nr:hypothetical protein OWV82_014465 [Melia azedarach]